MTTPTPPDWKNKPYFGDYLPIILDESGSLIYPDPPSTPTHFQRPLLQNSTYMLD